MNSAMQPMPTTPFPQTCYFVFREGEEDGPYSLEELETLFRNGEMRSATPCRRRSEKEWHDLGYLLNSAASIQQPDSPPPAHLSMQPRSALPQPHLVETPRPEGSGTVRELVTELVLVTRRQNQLLAGIKWGIVGILVMLAGSSALFLGLR
jgi:hypothetical protein